MQVLSLTACACVAISVLMVRKVRHLLEPLCSMSFSSNRLYASIGNCLRVCCNFNAHDSQRLDIYWGRFATCFLFLFAHMEVLLLLAISVLNSREFTTSIGAAWQHALFVYEHFESFSRFITHLPVIDFCASALHFICEIHYSLSAVNFCASTL